MKRILYLSVFLFIVSALQATDADSLIRILNTQGLPTGQQISLCDDICRLYMKNDYPKALPYALKGLSLAEKDKNSEMASAFNEYIGVFYCKNAHWDSASVYLEKALEQAIEAADEYRQMVQYLNLGSVYGETSNYTLAHEHFLKSLSLAEKNGYKHEQAKLLGNIGGMYALLGNYSQAVEYMEKTKSLAEELNEPLLMIHALYGLGSIYLNQGDDVEKGLKYKQRVAAISDSIGHVPYQASSNQSLAMAYLKRDDYNNALKHALKSLDAAEKLGNPGTLSGSWTVLSNIYLEQHQWKECEAAALQAWALDSTRLDYAPNIANNMAVANIYMGNNDKAVYFLGKYRDLKNQYNEKSFHETITDLEIKYETEKKELRIATLEKEKKFYIWLGVAGVVVLLLALGLLFVRHRMNMQKRKLAEQQVKQLEQEKQLIATQSLLDGETAERSRLARDLHDGLGGMLSVVKLNLKDMKSYSIMDGPDVEHFSRALDMLDQSIGELRRVAHHMMPESLMRYGLKVSLEDFCRAIPGAHFQYYGEDPRLDSRLEVLIYRCAYELINNAVKHAQATAIKVQLMVDSGVISLTVQDNGAGFDPKTVKSGSGLENIRTRVSAYNGKINIYSAPNKGTEISIEIEPS